MTAYLQEPFEKIPLLSLHLARLLKFASGFPSPAPAPAPPPNFYNDQHSVDDREESRITHDSEIMVIVNDEILKLHLEENDLVAIEQECRSNIASCRRSMFDLF